MKELVYTPEIIEKRIYLIREKRVMLDTDLAELYRVPTKRLNEQVRRNMRRFPEDFMFQLSAQEARILRSQFATSRWGGRRYLPCAFTEQGVAMLSSVLNSERAIAVNIAIMRTFVRIRQALFAIPAVAEKLRQLEDTLGGHDQQIHTLFEIIRKLTAPPVIRKRPIGFLAPDGKTRN